MSHYTQQEWIDFKKHRLPEEKQLQMEQHLQVCDSCMDVWLGLMGQEEINAAAEVIPDDFGRKTMQLVRAQSKPVSSLFSKVNKRRRLLAYYTAAAAITLMLVSGGVFQTIVNGLAYRQTQQISAIEGPARLLYSWPEQLSKTSAQYFQKIELTRNLKEVKR
ncbi:MAG TPA: hypothetical protein DD811_10550 [Syntrophomonas sp.]|jgi:hypothetical protein|nr:hypothetical protein [Syntrophomonas sp.]